VETHIPPSMDPDAIEFSAWGFLARQDTASSCPAMAPMKGFANTFSSFTAFRARWYSWARSHGVQHRVWIAEHFLHNSTVGRFQVGAKLGSTLRWSPEV